MKMYRGDLKPDLEVVLTDDGLPIDLTPTDNINVIGMQNREVLFTRPGFGSAAGLVTMQWEPGDTDTAGRIDIEVEVIWPGGKPQTFRPTGAVEIAPDYR